MDCKAERIPYRQTGHFSKISLDYIDQLDAIRPFFSHPPTIAGIQKAIAQRVKYNTDRETLVDVLEAQYSGVELSPKTKANIQSLLSKDCFTIVTAHQNNLFTGPLYFIYKILHAIRLADHLNTSVADHQFVPVFYMGTEDADLEELNHIWLGNEKISWKTTQKGAVGRMKIDKELLKLVDKMEGQLAVQPFGKDIISLIRDCYRLGDDIQTATFRFINRLFGDYGLVVLLPDHASLKKAMIAVFEDDLLNQTGSAIVAKTATELEAAGYKVQANPREINLFYLENDTRERLVTGKKGEYHTADKKFSFSKEEILHLVSQSPEKFSPNVILRGLYQETILPNVAFIGGGGELAYWLQLKDLFDHYKLPFPVLVLRNSFLLVEKKWEERIRGLGLNVEDFFMQEEQILNKWVQRESRLETKLNGSFEKLGDLYESFKKQAVAIDSTLEKHVDALRSRSVDRLKELEKKMLRAEKRKFTDQQRQIHTIRENLFPHNGLQERHDTLSYFYSKWGGEVIQKILDHSLALEQEFVTIIEQ